mgnify:CR=1 FL=1
MHLIIFPEALVMGALVTVEFPRAISFLIPYVSLIAAPILCFKFNHIGGLSMLLLKHQIVIIEFVLFEVFLNCLEGFYWGSVYAALELLGFCLGAFDWGGHYWLLVMFSLFELACDRLALPVQIKRECYDLALDTALIQALV